MIKSLFNFKGLNLWLFCSGIGLELLFAVAILTVSYVMLSAKTPGDSMEWFGLALIVSAFLGSLLIALGVGFIAHDGRGPTYGIASGIVGAMVLGMIFLNANNFQIGFILAAVTLLGGFNGGMLSNRRSRKK